MLNQDNLFYLNKINFLKAVKDFYLNKNLCITKDGELVGHVVNIKLNKEKTILYLTLDNDSIIKYII